MKVSPSVRKKKEIEGVFLSAGIKIGGPWDKLLNAGYRDLAIYCLVSIMLPKVLLISRERV